MSALSDDILTPRPEGSPPSAGIRLAGVGAILGGLLALAIATAFSLTGLGAAGDRAFGAFSGLTFLPSAACTLAMVGLYQARRNDVGRTAQRGIVAAAVGLTFRTVGQFGGEWLAFPRSGNYLIAPGTVLLTVGLLLYARGVGGQGVPRLHGTWLLLIALAPIVFFPIAAVVEVFAGNSFPPSLPDSYFTALYVLTAAFWFAFGTAVLREPNDVQ